MKIIGLITFRGVRSGHRIAEFRVTFAQFLRYLHIPSLLDRNVNYKLSI
jgi:hypothetical protein